MSQPTPGTQFGTKFNRALLRLQLLLLRANPLTLASSVFLAAVAVGFAWTLHAVWQLEAAHEAAKAEAARAAAAHAQALARAAAPAPVPVVTAPAADNLDQFYATLGQRRYVEQQVKALFGLAAKNGLTLAQGEYKSGYDRNAHVYTYQVNLPVKGSYQAIWQFAMGALRTMPFASLDDIGFRRDAIGDPLVEARLRLTFYLTDRPAGSAGGAP